MIRMGSGLLVDRAAMRGLCCCTGPNIALPSWPGVGSTAGPFRPPSSTQLSRLPPLLAPSPFLAPSTPTPNQRILGYRSFACSLRPSFACRRPGECPPPLRPCRLLPTCFLERALLRLLGDRAASVPLRMPTRFTASRDNLVRALRIARLACARLCE